MAGHGPFSGDRVRSEPALSLRRPASAAAGRRYLCISRDCHQKNAAVTRHDDEDLEQNPNIDAGENAIERKHLEVVEAEPHHFVDDRRAEEEQRHVARQLVPALLGVVERLAENETEEIVAGSQAEPEHRRDQRIEERHLDLHPHGVAGDQRERAERDADGAGNERHDGRAAQHPQADHQRNDRRGDQRPGACGNAIDAVDEEHRDTAVRSRRGY